MRSSGQFSIVCDATTVLDVDYTYETAENDSNSIRPLKTYYPNGNISTFEYSPTDGVSDHINRVTGVKWDGSGSNVIEAAYKYLGVATPTKITYDQVNYSWTLYSSGTPYDYSGSMDRFNRITNVHWKYTTPNPDTDLVDIDYTYDRNSNRLSRAVGAGASGLDNLYSYDNLNRLTNAQQGTLSSGSITSETFEQDWTFDALGNWTGFKQDDDGDNTWDLEQTRTSNTVNEITAISASTGTNWKVPAYDNNGNMTTMPQPSDLGDANGYKAIYDAWNRLVEIQEYNGTEEEWQTLERYTYDGIHRRIIKETFSGGVSDEIRHSYYNHKWQLLEERVGDEPGNASAERQFVWGARYIDDLILRMRDTDGNGTLDETLYAIQDANFNVVAAVDTSGTVQERMHYDSYGHVEFLDASFSNGSSTSSKDWEILYAGYRYDSGTGLYCVRFRYYHAELGRWLQRDPIGYVGEMSLYQYVGSNPIVYTDSLGLIRWGQFFSGVLDVGIGVVAVAGAIVGAVGTAPLAIAAGVAIGGYHIAYGVANSIAATVNKKIDVPGSIGSVYAEVIRQAGGPEWLAETAEDTIDGLKFKGQFGKTIDKLKGVKEDFEELQELYDNEDELGLFLWLYDNLEEEYGPFDRIPDDVFPNPQQWNDDWKKYEDFMKEQEELKRKDPCPPDYLIPPK